ncbi:restriction endonuclease subunit S [Mycoplasma sp. SH20]|uniref:restriction endonuclease subunit S n=1 Tax=Mycoplasma sp. SH20 TaxID=3401672 RepID=UPI003AAD06AF
MEGFMQKDKLVPDVRFKGFEEEWKTNRLCEVALKFDNLRIPVSESLRIKGPYPYYGANGVQDYVSGFTHNGEFVLIAEDGANDLDSYPSNYVNGKFWANNHVHVLQGFKDTLDNKFLNYSFANVNFKPLLTGGDRAKLTASALDTINIKVPIFNEQRKIGSLLNNIDQLLLFQKSKLEKLQIIKQSLLNKMFTSYEKKMPEIRFKGFNEDWNTDKVCNLFKITRGEVLAQNQISEFQNEIYAYPVYSSQTLKNGLMGYYKEYLFDNCVTWTTDGANAGTVKYRNEKFYCTNVCGVLEEGKLKPNDCFAELLNLVTPNHVTRAGNPKLMNSTMGEIIINYPNSTIEYTKISTLFMSIDSLIHSCDQKLEKLNNIKKALLEKMFC